jgi:hypothetical protein
MPQRLDLKATPRAMFIRVRVYKSYGLQELWFLGAMPIALFRQK